jgi:hypothetical protein
MSLSFLLLITGDGKSGDKAGGEAATTPPALAVYFRWCSGLAGHLGLLHMLLVIGW